MTFQEPVPPDPRYDLIRQVPEVYLQVEGGTGHTLVKAITTEFLSIAISLSVTAIVLPATLWN